MKNQSNNIFPLGISWRKEKTGVINHPAMHPQSSVPRDVSKNAVWESWAEPQLRQDQMGEVQTSKPYRAGTFGKPRSLYRSG